MSDQIQFDEDQSRAVEWVYGTPDVAEQRRVTLDALGLRPGERVLDLGCGPGFLAAEMAEQVGRDGRVDAVDVSPSMLAIAGRRSRSDDAAPVELAEADVTDLPYDDEQFDAAVSTQVYEYVADMPRALAEVRRVLAPGGRLLVIDSDWDSIVWRSNDDERMARVLRAWDDHLVHRDLPRRLPQLLREAGFDLERTVVVPMLNVGYEPETYSAGAMGLIAGYVAGRGDVSADEAAAWAQDLVGLGPDYFFSLNRYLFVARR